MPSFSFDPANDIPDLTNRVILVTGGTAGLGKSSILALAVHNPAQIFFTGRSQSRADGIVDQVRAIAPNIAVTFLSMDLGSAKSIQAAAESLQLKSSRLDILMCNAGIMAVPASTTADGYEVQFGTNHLGHAILMRCLLSVLQKTAEQPNADVRIISNTSTGFQAAPEGGIQFDTLKTEQEMGQGGRWLRYGQSKLANILYTQEMARRHPQILSLVIHPGVIMTDLVTTLSQEDQEIVKSSNVGKIISEEDGIKNQLWAATSPREELENGQFYEPVGTVGSTTKASTDRELAKRLWEWTEEQIDALITHS
ncbi:hypothetical protein LTR70_010328 [Exophiala xenobiotica]|nr:hypothetical protein LTR70_010328 [Exophiala xenobiotica]